MIGIKKPDDIIIRFSNYSQRAINAHQIQIHDGKFRPEELSEKGQLFVLADGVDGHNTDPQAKEMVVRVMHESYYSTPARDIVTSLENAFKDANTLVHEIFTQQADRTHLGIACTGLVLTNDRVYVARVGDSSTYRITRQKLQNVSTLKHLTFAKKDNPSRIQPATQLALGVGPEIEPEVSEVPLKTGDCFLLCSDRLLDVGVEEIRQIVRSNSPKEACQKLIDSARQMGVADQTEVQVIWVSSIQPTPDSALGDLMKLPFLTKIKLIAAAAILLTLIVAFLQTIELERIFPSDSGATAPNNHENTYSSEARPLIAEANAFFDAGELDIALSRYQDLQKIDAGDSLASARIRDIFEIYKDKANLYYQKGYYTAALTFYEKALELEPKSTQLASLIAACEKKLGRAPDEKDVTAKTAASNRGDEIRVNKKASSSSVIPETSKQTQIWDWGTIPDKEIIAEESGIRFSHSSTRSKLLSRNELDKFELQLRTAVQRETHGRYGVIVGYQTMTQSPYETFYLISMSSEKTFLLHRYANFKKEILASVAADSLANKESSTFTVRCNGSNLTFYYGEHRIFDWTAPKPIVGRIGLYAGPDTDVTFSNLKFSEKP